MTKAQIKKLKAQVKRNKKLFEEGKIPFFSNFENEKALFESIESKKELIAKAMKNLEGFNQEWFMPHDPDWSAEPSKLSSQVQLLGEVPKIKYGSVV